MTTKSFPERQVHSPKAAPDEPAEEPPSRPDDSPLAGVAASVSNRQLLRWMFRFLRPVRALVILACTYVALFVAVEVLTVRQTGAAVDHIKHLIVDQKVADAGFWAWLRQGEGQPFDLRRLPGLLINPTHQAAMRDLMLVLAGLVGLMGILRYKRTVTESRLSMNMVFYIREAVYDKLQRVGLAFHDALSSGQLINRALADLQHVRVFVQTAVLTSLDIVIAVSFYMILVLTRHWQLALLSLVPLPFWTWYILRFGRRVQPANRQVMEAGDRDVALITENIAGVHVVRAFATEKQEIQKYNSHAGDYYQRILRRIAMFANFTPVMRAIATASHLSLFWLAGVLAVYGRLNVGDFVILGGAMGAILMRLQLVGTISEQYQNAIVSARRLYEILHASPTVPEKPGAIALPPGPGAVTFENVTFGYDPRKPVLHDVSFEVPGNSIVAVVGPTGAGKSTLVNLVARFYDPQRGRVLIDGTDVRDATLASLRTQVAFVFQETYLFSDTVSANIAYGRPNITAGEIEAAARLAQAHEFIETLPKQYDTILGERGASLSGGQRQRLAIARAIVTNPRILVLDDATASIDPETEELIRRGMRFVMHGRTTFVIAHRVSTVKQADLVIVVEGGRVTQVGTHAQLMTQDGYYRDTAVAQLYGDEPPLGPEGEPLSHMDRVRDRREVAEVVGIHEEQRHAEEEL